MLPQQSRMTQNWSVTTPPPLVFALVWVFATNMKTLVPQHASNAVGGVKTQELPHVTVMSGAQLTTGGLVATAAPAGVHVPGTPPQSISCQTCSAFWLQGLPAVLLVVVLMIVSV